MTLKLVIEEEIDSIEEYKQKKSTQKLDYQSYYLINSDKGICIDKDQKEIDKQSWKEGQYE